MGDRVARWWPFVALMAAMGVVLGGGSVVVVWVLCAFVLGWSWGRSYEVRVQARLALRGLLVAFTTWAEETLASAPEELEPEEEEHRRRLQTDYQRAQRELERLG